MAPASAAVEFLPLAFGLGQAVGDGVDRRRMMAEAAVAAMDLDVLDLGPVLVQAACQAQMPSVRLKMEVVGTGGGSASVSSRSCSSILQPLTIS